LIQALHDIRQLLQDREQQMSFASDRPYFQHKLFPVLVVVMLFCCPHVNAAVAVLLQFGELSACTKAAGD
jgi:hypothetical protein